jgi:NHL repeat
VDGAGNLLIADQQSGRIRVVAASTGTFYDQDMTAGDVYTVVGVGPQGEGFQSSGDGGPATRSELYGPQGLAVDNEGNVLVADADNSRIQAVAGRTGTFWGQQMTAGDAYTVAGDGLPGDSGDHGKATSARLLSPRGVGVDHAGNLLIADTYNDRIRVVPDATGTYYGDDMRAGYIYTIAGGGNLTGNGTLATKAALSQPDSVAVDAAGNVLISGFDQIQVLAESTGTFYQQPMTAGDLYTIAGTGTLGFSGDGGPATAADLGDPAGIALDQKGNVLIADTDNNRIRVVAESSGAFYGQAMTAGDIYTVAGSGPGKFGQYGTPGFTGDGGPGTKAEIDDPVGVAADGANLVFADSDNQRIRMVTG